MEMNQMSGPAVRAEGLVKHYNGREAAVEAVRGVDLEVHTGEIFGFLGPKGMVRLLRVEVYAVQSARANAFAVPVPSACTGVASTQPARNTTLISVMSSWNAET